MMNNKLSIDYFLMLRLHSSSPAPLPLETIYTPRYNTMIRENETPPTSATNNHNFIIQMLNKKLD